MADSVIKIENVSKEYRLGTINHATLGGDLQSWWAKLRGKQDPNSPLDSSSCVNRNHKFFALRDISFDVTRGEIIGIIGRNGAGKSTLLKILSRITRPTSGRVVIEGRVSSLLEVGTGFHPELTGRENVFLNGAILGMSKTEICNKLDQIVSFAEIEQFIDTPVKRYSSGMYVRLAFAVAAHLEPEILIVDEVLAVGDSVFQKKCIDKMLEVSTHGRTVLFVSHNLAALKVLCRNAVLLEKGRLTYRGTAQEAIDAYIGDMTLKGEEIDLSSLERSGYKNEVIFQSIKFLEYPVRFGESIRLRLRLKTTGAKRRFKFVDLAINIKDRNNSPVIHCSNRFIHLQIEHESDSNEYIIEIQNILKPGVYVLGLFLRAEDVIQDWLNTAVKLEIAEGNPYAFPDTQQIQGVVLPQFTMSVVRP